MGLKKSNLFSQENEQKGLSCHEGSHLLAPSAICLITFMERGQDKSAVADCLDAFTCLLGPYPFEKKGQKRYVQTEVLCINDLRQMFLPRPRRVTDTWMSCCWLGGRGGNYVG